MSGQENQVSGDQVVPTATTEAPVIDLVVAEAAQAVAEPKLSASDYAKFKAKADQLRLREAEYKGYQSQAQAAKAELESYRALAKSDPVAFLEQTGLSFDELTARLTGLQDDPVRRTQEELRELKESLKRRDEEAQKSTEEAHWNAAFSHFESVVRSNDTLELLQAELESEPEQVMGMLQRITQISHERGKPLTFEQTAQQYEDYLFEQVKKYSTKSKFKSLVAPAPELKKEQASTESAKTEPKTESSKTLSNQASQAQAPLKSQRAELTERQQRLVDEQERLAAVVRNLQNLKR